METFRQKMASGKFFSTVMVISTYCAIIVVSAVAVALDKMQANTFLGEFAGFTGLAGSIVTSYFGKDKINKVDDTNLPV